jgi:nitrogenase molybdenum-iron protein beta chain
VGELRRVAEASLVVSLPYGRRAAAALARRLGVPLVETALPFGIDGTTRWIQAVAAATGRQERGRDLVDAELERIAPRLEWVVPAVFRHRTVSFLGDPHLLEGFLDLAIELGLRLGPLVVTAKAQHAQALADRAAELGIAFEPTREALERHLGAAVREARVDLLVTNSLGASFLGGPTPAVELGYPSYFTHALHDRPFLGYSGALALASEMANALRRIDLVRMHAAGRDGPEQTRPRAEVAAGAAPRKQR